MLKRSKICPYCQRVYQGRCEHCYQAKAPERALRDKERGSSTARGYDSRWEKTSRGFRKKHPWCVHCLERGKRTLAEVVDHIVPHRGDKKIFWDRKNWQSLCKRCHDYKTARGQ